MKKFQDEIGIKSKFGCIKVKKKCLKEHRKYWENTFPNHISADFPYYKYKSNKYLISFELNYPKQLRNVGKLKSLQRSRKKAARNQQKNNFNPFNLHNLSTQQKSWKIIFLKEIDKFPVLHIFCWRLAHTLKKVKKEKHKI